MTYRQPKNYFPIRDMLKIKLHKQKEKATLEEGNLSQKTHFGDAAKESSDIAF